MVSYLTRRYCDDLPVWVDSGIVDTFADVAASLPVWQLVCHTLIGIDPTYLSVSFPLVFLFLRLVSPLFTNNL